MPRGKKNLPAPQPRAYAAAVTVHPSKLYAVGVHDNKTLTEALARMQVNAPAQSHSSSRPDPASSPKWSQQRFGNQNFRDEMSYAMRAYLDMPMSLPQSRDLSRRWSNEDVAAIAYYEQRFGPPPRRSPAIATLSAVNNQSKYRDMAVDMPRRWSNEDVAAIAYYEQRFGPPPRRSPAIATLSAVNNQSKYRDMAVDMPARLSSTPPAIPRPARRAFVRPGLVTRDSRDHRGSCSCF